MSFNNNTVRHVGDLKQAEWGGMSKLTFTTKVMPLFGLSLLVAAGGVMGGLQILASLGRGTGMIVLIAALIAELGLVFTSGMWQQKEGLNKVLFFTYALLSGMTLVPLLMWAGAAGGLGMIAQALTVSAVTFGGLAFYGMTTKRDFSSLGGFIFIACLALLVGGLFNIFFQSSVFSLIASIAGVGIFSAFTVYEMNMIRNHYTDDQYVGAALGLLIAFIGLFQSVLRLFGIAGSSDD